MAFDIRSAAYPIHFDQALTYKLDDALVERIVGKTDGPIRTSYGTTAVDALVLPNLSIHNACAEILDLMCGHERAVNQGEKNRQILILCELECFRAIQAQADSVKWLSESPEEMEGRGAGPSLKIDFSPLLPAFAIHLCAPFGEAGERYSDIMNTPVYFKRSLG